MNATPQEIKSHKAKAMRYKKAVLDTLSHEAIISELYDINEGCETIHYITDSEGYGQLLGAMEGDEDDAFEFKMMFSDVCAKAEMLLEELMYKDYKDFDDCVVALIGRNQKLVGYDSVEEDYYSLTEYEVELATTESGKRMCRKTKADMLATIGQAMSTVLAFIDLRQQYDYLQATMEIILGENTAILQNIKRIDELYFESEKSEFHKDNPATKELDRILNEMPDRFWIE
ncbi:MAG: hypothetical protein R3Y63_08870 [Eubacteriales bacterium]